MAPRSQTIDPSKIQVVLTWSRVVRRSFLCGYDQLTGIDYEHRRQWIQDRLKRLARVYTVDIGTFSIMQAFVCDGMACNWTLHAKHFEHFTPILDVVHAICYLYQAALAGQPCEASWQRYCQWAQLLWSGQPDELLNQMKSWQAVVGKAQEDDPESSPRVLLADAIRYVSNQKSRMKYDQYRRDGLPTTSCYVESTIKMINRRVKGTEKFWSKNADPILQLRADAVSETNSMDEFWKKRPAKIPVSTHYNMAG